MEPFDTNRSEEMFSRLEQFLLKNENDFHKPVDEFIRMEFESIKRELRDFEKNLNAYYIKRLTLFKQQHNQKIESKHKQRISNLKRIVRDKNIVISNQHRRIVSLINQNENIPNITGS